MNPENPAENPSPRATHAQAAPAGGGDGASSGLPLRGLAMVLIAVGVMLGLWGLYSLTSGGDDNATSTAASATNSPGSGSTDATLNAPVEGETNTAAPGSQAAQSSQPGQPASPSEGAPAKPGEQAPGQDSASQGGGAGAAGGAAAGGAAAGGADQAQAQQEVRVNVLNNSTVVDYAKNEADTLSKDGYTTAHVGNLPNEVFPETTVYFEKGNAAAEGVARELADRYKGVAKENDATKLPKEANDGQVTVILTSTR